jgi:hypothetical protein
VTIARQPYSNRGGLSLGTWGKANGNRQLRFHGERGNAGAEHDDGRWQKRRGRRDAEKLCPRRGCEPQSERPGEPHRGHVPAAHGRRGEVGDERHERGRVQALADADDDRGGEERGESSRAEPLAGLREATDSTYAG